MTGMHVDPDGLPAGWVTVVPPPHRCSPPLTVPKGVGAGSVWACPDCGQRHELRGTEGLTRIPTGWKRLPRDG